MYRARRDRAAHPVLDDVRVEVPGRSGTAGELRAALRGRGLDVVYQPIVALSSGRIAAMEALARWTTPTGASVAPEVFIPVAEESGLIGELGAQILRMASRDAASWQSIAPIGVRVNVSAHEIRSATFYNDVMRALEFAELDPKLLGLEITESVLVEEGTGAEATLSRLRDAGIMLMLDDFGTGYSSLSYLQRFPVVDMLKIDRTFLTGDEGEAVVQAVIGLGRAFGLKVCAEGVENAAQHNRVVQVGCDYAQGYYFARPIAGELVPQLLGSWAPFMPA